MRSILRITVILLALVAVATLLAGGVGRVGVVDHSPYASVLSNAAVGDAHAKPNPGGGGGCADRACSLSGVCYHQSHIGTDCFTTSGSTCEIVSCP